MGARGVVGLRANRASRECTGPGRRSQRPRARDLGARRRAVSMFTEGELPPTFRGAGSAGASTSRSRSIAERARPRRRRGPGGSAPVPAAAGVLVADGPPGRDSLTVSSGRGTGGRGARRWPPWPRPRLASPPGRTRGTGRCGLDLHLGHGHRPERLEQGPQFIRSDCVIQVSDIDHHGGPKLLEGEGDRRGVASPGPARRGFLPGIAEARPGSDGPVGSGNNNVPEGRGPAGGGRTDRRPGRLGPRSTRPGTPAGGGPPAAPGRPVQGPELTRCLGPPPGAIAGATAGPETKIPGREPGIFVADRPRGPRSLPGRGGTACGVVLAGMPGAPAGRA